MFDEAAGTAAKRAAAAIVAAYLVALAVNRAAVRVRGPSMAPTYHAGDLLLTLPAHARMLRPGRVVVVEEPARRGHLVIKRIHAVTPQGVDVRGDAPLLSTDSRVWGPLAPAAVRRIVLARIRLGPRGGATG